MPLLERRAGERRHRITIEQKATARDANGNPTETWTEFATVSAKLSTSGGREFFQAKQVNAGLSHQIEIDYRAGITAVMRVKYLDPKNSDAARYFNITAIVNPDETRWTLLLFCSEIS